MVGYIYIHTSPSGKSYIGQTYNVKGTKARWRNGYGYDNGTIIRTAIDKYGWDNFSHDILHEVEEDDLETLVDSLNKLEEYEIMNRKTIVPDGYNSVSGGYNSMVSDATRKNMSVAARKRYLNGEAVWNKGLPKELQPRYGKKQTDKQKEAARRAIKKSIGLGKIAGHKVGEFRHSEDSKKKISDAQRQYSSEKKALIYKKRNETMLKKYGKKSLGRSSMAGKRWFTNGVYNVVSFDAPSGYYPGRTVSPETRLKISMAIKGLHRDGVYRTDLVLDKRKKKD